MLRTLARRGLFAAAALLPLAACSDREPLGPEIHGTASFEEDDVFALQAVAGQIRIGVVPTATTVRIGGTGDFVVKNKGNGTTLFTGSAEEFDVVLQTPAITTRARWMQVACTTSLPLRDSWLALAASKGYQAYTEFTGPTANCWRLRLGVLPFPQNVALENDFRARATADGLTLPPNAPVFVTVTTVAGTPLLKVVRGSYQATLGSAVTLEPLNGRVIIGGVEYRGSAEVGFNSTGTLAGINQLPYEEYLWGVVPRELPPTLWPELEALKAQAVAARTYALSGLGKRSRDGYDLLATTSDQVYGGYPAEHPLSTQAVDETAGIVATYEGRLIEALFSSTTGGHTSNNEEIYNSAPVPYLRGVPDAQRGQAFEHVPSLEVFKFHANPRSLRNAKEGDWESDWSRYHRWSFEWSNEEISEVVSAFAGQPVGKVLEINALERGPSGRVTLIEFVTEAGRFTQVKDAIRSALKFKNASGTYSSLLSTLFFIEPVYDRRTKELSGFAAYGGGWGHGIGLSQTGAVGMAEKKHTFDEILKHYYQGIDLEQRY